MKYLHRSEMFGRNADNKLVKTSSHTYNAGRNKAKRERKAAREAEKKGRRKDWRDQPWPAGTEFKNYGGDQ